MSCATSTQKTIKDYQKTITNTGSHSRVIINNDQQRWCFVPLGVAEGALRPRDGPLSADPTVGAADGVLGPHDKPS